MKNFIRVRLLKSLDSLYNMRYAGRAVSVVCMLAFSFSVFSCSSSSVSGVEEEAKPGQIVGVIGRSGGNLSVSDSSSAVSGAEIEVPKEAISGDVQFSIDESYLPQPLPSGIKQIGPCVSFFPHGQKFKRKASIFLPYTDSDNNGLIDGGGDSEKKATVFYFNPEIRQWEKQSTSFRSFSSNRTGIKTDHLSTFLLAVDESVPDTGNDNNVDPALVAGEYFTGQAEYTFKNGEWVLWPKGCIVNETVRCGQSWNLTVVYKTDGLFAVIDKYTTMTGGYPVDVSSDFKSAVINVFDIPEFEKVKRSGDAALWTWSAQFEKDHTRVRKYRVLDDSSLEAAAVTGEKIYADVEVFDAQTIKVDWKVPADTDLIPGDILVVIFEAVYNG